MRIPIAFIFGSTALILNAVNRYSSVFCGIFRNVAGRIPIVSIGFPVLEEKPIGTVSEQEIWLTVVPMHFSYISYSFCIHILKIKQWNPPAIQVSGGFRIYIICSAIRSSWPRCQCHCWKSTPSWHRTCASLLRFYRLQQACQVYGEKMILTKGFLSY